MVSSDFRRRLRWTPFSKTPSGGGGLNALAVRDGNVAIFGTVEFGSLITSQAIAPNPFNPEKDSIRDAYFAILRTR
jgi:hypothetical protein